MNNSHRIRLSRKDSVFSTNRESTVDVELRTSSKLLPYPDVIDTVNSQTVYENERDASNKYRLIVTINPYCTNVLFNTFTEVVKEEGSDKVKVIGDDKAYSGTELTDGTLYGLKQEINRQYVLDNTELSKTEHGYEYQPGLDIFTNHIMRNTSFKMVCDYSEHDNENRGVFNTIKDYMRYADGKNVLYNTTLFEANDFKLKYGENEKNLNWKHLYNKDDILGFEDATVFNERLIEENGWYGFKNNSSIPSKTSDGKNALYVEKILNDRDGCEFIDMYPDRSLFSFNPKYNQYRKRLEYNWDVCLTYPYRNEYDYGLISDGKGVNGLKVMSLQKMYGSNSEEILMFRTYCKHGLSKGSSFVLYINKIGYIETVEEGKPNKLKYYRVYNVGNMKHEEREHFFYVNDMSILEELDIDRKETLENINKSLNGKIKEGIFFNRSVGGHVSSYYLRLFKKIPNFKWRKRNLTEAIAEGNGDINFEKFVKENACDGENYMYDFDKEWYKLAYANTIYNDDNSQITFTDVVDISHLTDNLGRKVSSIYVTFIKSNRGNEKWYEGTEEDKKKEEIEYSHAFGKVTSGIRFLSIEDDKYNYILNEGEDNEVNIKKERGKLSDVNILNNLGVYESKSLEGDITFRGGNYKGETDTFLGDLVEFNPYESYERVLDDVMHRFNTKQREMGANDYLKTFKYTEILTDDYDKDDFALNGGNGTEGDYIDISSETYKIGDVDLKIWQRPEGYYYKPHHEVMFREIGKMKQTSHFEIRLKESKPVSLDGIYISIKTKIPHYVATGDKMYVCDDFNCTEVYDKEKRRFVTDKWYQTEVVYVTGKYDFIIRVPEIENKNWIEICEMINNGELVVRRKNEDIPIHAFRIGKNKFVWRDTLKVGDVDVEKLPEYTFTNGCFYVNKEINFFLRRQDTENINGLYARSIFPNDIEGVKMEVSNHIYKDGSKSVC